MKSLLKLLFLLAFSQVMIAQPSIEWQKTFGGSGEDFAHYIQQTSDGGFIAVGSTSSNDGDVTNNQGGRDFWVLKLDNIGNIEWQKTLGGSGVYDFGRFIQSTTDGGYILMGEIVSNDGDVSIGFGLLDCWVVKLNHIGQIEWEKTFGGDYFEYSGGIRQTDDGGYIMAMETGSVNGNVPPVNPGLSDYWIVKLSNSGEVLWQKIYGGNLVEAPFDIQQTSDGGFIVAGESWTSDGSDFWVLRLNPLGELLWQKTIGSTLEWEVARSIQETSDNGFIIGGESGMTNNIPWIRLNDGLIVKLDSEGSIEWQKTFGGAGDDHVRAVRQTNDGSYIAFGETSSSDGDVMENYGFTDCWVMKLSESGEIQWVQTLGGAGEDFGRSIEQTSDGGFILAGFTDSFDGDVAENAGLLDAWIIKLSPESVPTAEPSTQAGTLQLFPNPAQQSITVTLPETEVAFSLSITDILGRELSRQTVQNGTSLDISALPNGIYCATAFTSAGKVFVSKFNIQKG